MFNFLKGLKKNKTIETEPISRPIETLVDENDIAFAIVKINGDTDSLYVNVYDRNDPKLGITISLDALFKINQISEDCISNKNTNTFH